MTLGDNEVECDWPTSLTVLLNCSIGQLSGLLFQPQSSPSPSAIGLFLLLTFIPLFTIGGSKGGRQGRAPPLWVQILSFSCSFWENLGKIIGWRPYLGGWRPPVWEILDPPLFTALISGVSPFFIFALISAPKGNRILAHLMQPSSATR